LVDKNVVPLLPNGADPVKTAFSYRFLLSQFLGLSDFWTPPWDLSKQEKLAVSCFR